MSVSKKESVTRTVVIKYSVPLISKKILADVTISFISFYLNRGSVLGVGHTCVCRDSSERMIQ